MQRRFDSLRKGPFDLLVVGGGIYGAWTVCIAARCGLSVALVEKGDWASGTSSVSSKLIHGGLRYLEHLRFSMVKKSLRERALLTSCAPHLVRPSRFVIPVYSRGRVGPLRLRAGLGLYRFLAGADRPGGNPMNLNPSEAAGRYDFLREEGLLRILSYGDAITDDARLTLEVVEAALQAGAAAVNYVEAIAPLEGESCAGGAVVRNLADGDTARVAASVVVNTAGPWAAGIPGCTEIAGRIRLTKGVHLVFPPLPTDDAFLFLTRSDRRVLFLIPWHGRTLVGTTDTDYRESPDSLSVTPGDVDYILEELSHVLRDGTWNRESILGASAGLRTLLEVPGRLPGDLSREWRVFEPVPRLLVSVGGKLTSARADAAVIVNRVLTLLEARAGKVSSACAAPPLRGPVAPYREWARDMTERGLSSGLDAETAGHCLRYGRSVTSIHERAARDPSLAERLDPDLPFCAAEVAFGAEAEMAHHLDDLLRRRLPLMLLRPPERRLAERAAELAAPHLGWDEDRVGDEVIRTLKIWDAAGSLRES
jgi:glycerol-3-phosphate dehydrogenase